MRTAVRCFQAAAQPSKPVFYDMQHSNNAARIRLWLMLKGGDVASKIDRRVIKYTDLNTQEFIAVNPLKKVPAFVRADGATVFESPVILNYLEDKYAADSPVTFTPATPEGRQQMDLMIRIHDLYVASPNCTAPGFSHSQGAMYLSFGWHGPARGMDAETRAAKVAELWKQLSWLEKDCAAEPWLVADCAHVSLADFTWFPTCVFMEFMLPRVFGWNPPFEEGPTTPFPKLARWYTGLKAKPSFANVHEEIWSYWVEMEAAGQFKPIQEEVAARDDLKFLYP